MEIFVDSTNYFSGCMHNKRKKVFFVSQSDEHSRIPSLPERTMLVKLFYRKDENSEAAVREFRRLKKQRRGPISGQALRDEMMKFKLMGQLRALPGRGRKRIRTTIVEDVATVIVKASSESLHETVSEPTISRTLDMPYSSV